MKTVILSCFMLTCSLLTAQELTGSQLLENAIDYHDPNGIWEQFAGTLHIELESPNKPVRLSTVRIDRPNDYFKLTIEVGEKETLREVNGNNCVQSKEDGSLLQTTVDDAVCERTVMYRDYYTYLYGLPMKLRDPGTIVDPVVKRTVFKGKEYLVLRVTYDEAVGTDIWQFYFDPETYAMEVYQFFKGADETTGEYILLTDEITVKGIKLPKDRAWYYNKNNGYLGTDKLVLRK